MLSYKKIINIKRRPFDKRENRIINKSKDIGKG